MMKRKKISFFFQRSFEKTLEKLFLKLTQIVNISKWTSPTFYTHCGTHHQRPFKQLQENEFQNFDEVNKFLEKIRFIELTKNK